MDLSFDAYRSCRLCPRRCGVDRTTGQGGRCREGATVHAARSALHYWEEPPISGEAGSGAVFFSGCPLGCVYCQNHEISRGLAGLEVTPARLAAMMLELQSQGALNINLVTGLHFAPTVAAAVARARELGLTVPVVANTSGYELPELVRALAGTVDIWLTDFKYASNALARRLSAAPDYPEVADRALSAMLENLRDAGGRLETEEGALQRGIVVRHLVLPGHADDSCAVLDRVWSLCGNEADLSVMNQYTPNAACRARGGELARSVSPEEYEAVLDHADDLGFERLWWQQGGTVDESFVPAFDAEGVRGPEVPW